VEQRTAAAFGRQPQDGLAPESLRQGKPLAMRAPRAYPGEGLVEEMAVLETPRRLLTRDHGQVDVPARDQPHGGARVGSDDLESHRRFLLQQVSEHWRQQPLAEIVADRNPESDCGMA